MRPLVLLALLAASLGATDSPTADRVLVVYNAVWPSDADGDGTNDSEQVARYYARKRGIPAQNLLGVSCVTSGAQYYYYTGQWPAFHDEVLAPIKAKLATLGPTAIDVVCLCYGMPYELFTPSGQGLCLDNVLMAPEHWQDDGSNVFWTGNPYLETTPGFGTDHGHFDHALYDFAAGDRLYLVSRLDGPGGMAGAMERVDQALYAERYLAAGAGYFNGTVYVDSRQGQSGGGTPYTDAFLGASNEALNGDYGSYYSADVNIAYAEHFVAGSGLPLKWENTVNALQIGDSGATFSDGSAGTQAPKALFYGGWYNFGGYHDVFAWLPGAAACDLNSDSLNASTLRGDGSFGPSALKRGASCVAGVIGEPYLTGHQRPNVMLYYLLHGYCWAEAAALSTPSVGWMPLAIGDPLYAPLRAKTPVHDTSAPLPAVGTPYVAAGTGPSSRTVMVLVDDSAGPEVAQATVEYGTSATYGTSVSSGEGWWRRHALTLTGLAADATYHYRVRLVDPVGNASVTGDLLFRTGVDVVAFTSPEVVVDRGADSVSVRVARIGSGAGAMSVDYATADLSARAGADYAERHGTLAWSDGDAGERSIVIPVLDHAVGGGDVTFRVALSDPTGGGIDAPATVVVTIADPTAPPTGGGDGGGGGGGSGARHCGLGSLGALACALIALRRRGDSRQSKRDGASAAPVRRAAARTSLSSTFAKGA